MNHLVVFGFILLIWIIYLITYPTGPWDFLRYIRRGWSMGPGIFGLLILLIFQLLLPPMLPIFIAGSPLIITGYPLVLLGFLIFFLAKVHLGSSWGVPAQHDIKKQKSLITGGIYKYSRNPIYVGLLTFFVGSEILFNSWLVLLAVPVAIMVHFRVLVEEKLLHQHFPSAYLKYIASTPRYF